MSKYILLPLVFFVFSCNKEKNESLKTEDFILAGDKLSSTVVYSDLDPDIILLGKEVDCHTFKGMDSIDFNSDLKWDLKFCYSYVNDIFGECCIDCAPHIYLLQELKVLNPNLEILADKEGYVYMLNEGDSIKSQSSWSDNKNLVFFTTINPSFAGRGYWSHNEVTQDKFVGFRLAESKDTTYGWVKINTSQTIAVKEFAIKTLK